MNICILGAGTYGSYVVDSIQRKYPNAEITVLDIGDHTIKNEKEIGLISKLKQSMYRGLTHGRFFGFGGTSHKWGGQLLTYSDNDFAHPDKFMKGIIEVNKKNNGVFLKKFKIENKYLEKRLTDNLHTKTGVWLSMLHRNLFYWFKLDKRKNVCIQSHCRVVRLVSRDKKYIESVIYLENGKEKTASYDYYFLTSGAFESVRILLSSNLLNENKVYFSDHLSQKIFKVKGSTRIGTEDFIFRMKGTSLITKRIIGEIDDVSYYIHPVFNLKFPFFEMVKDIAFYHNFAISKIGNYIMTTIRDIPHVVGFAWSVIALRKMYVMNNEWFLYIDIENPSKCSYIELSIEKDKYDLPGLNIYYYLDNDAVDIYKKAQKQAIEYLDICNVNYEVVAEKIDVQTCEDIYHPYGMIRFDSLEDYYTRWDNMLMVTTGILSRSGGINPTAAIFPLVDEFVNTKM